MEIVLDTNILISSLLRNGLTRDIISVSPFKMYTVEYANLEIEKHKDELLSKSKLDEKSFDYLKDFIFSKISFIPLEDLASFKDRAIEVMSEIDIDDSPFLALAMSLDCPIWSNDGHFKRQDVVKAFTIDSVSWYPWCRDCWLSHKQLPEAARPHEKIAQMIPSSLSS